MTRRGSILVLLLGLGFCLGCPDVEEPNRESARVLSLSPRGTRALLAMKLEGRIIVADPESRALLPAPPASPSDPDSIRPALALVPPLFERLAPELDALLARAAHVVVVDPHDLDDARALYDEIGEALDEPARAAATQRRIADLLGPIGAASAERVRPCVVAITALEPLTLAGGHSFESNVLELLGAESATHDLLEAHRIESDRDGLRSLAPDLVLVTAEGLSPDALRALASDLAPLEVVPTFFDPEPIWLGDRAAAEPELEEWARLVERARGRARERDGVPANCGRAWGTGASSGDQGQQASRSV